MRDSRGGGRGADAPCLLLVPGPGKKRKKKGKRGGKKKRGGKEGGGRPEERWEGCTPSTSPTAISVMSAVAAIGSVSVIARVTEGKKKKRGEKGDHWRAGGLSDSFFEGRKKRGKGEGKRTELRKTSWARLCVRI